MAPGMQTFKKISHSRNSVFTLWQLCFDASTSVTAM